MPKWVLNRLPAGSDVYFASAKIISLGLIEYDVWNIVLTPCVVLPVIKSLCNVYAGLNAKLNLPILAFALTGATSKVDFDVFFAATKVSLAQVLIFFVHE